MTYYTKVLRGDETVHFLGRLHRIIYLPAGLLLALSVALAITRASVSASDQAGLALAIASLVALALGLLNLFAALIRRFTTEIVVTNLRVISKTGLVVRRTSEMNMSKIETVDVVQGVSGRLFDFGDVAMRGVGAGFEPLRRVAQPLALRNSILVG